MTSLENKTVYFLEIGAFFHDQGRWKVYGEYPHLVTNDPQHAGINTAISEGFSSVERRASSRQEAHEP